jgi:hypothetical protein
MTKFGRSYLAAVAFCTAMTMTAAPAFAGKTVKDETSALVPVGPAADHLHNVPVFYIADAAGQPVEADETPLYLTRYQASVALGLMRGELAAKGQESDLHVEVSDLARAADIKSHRYVKPFSRIDAAGQMAAAPLYLVRDNQGSPFTVKDAAGRKRVYFFLSDADAAAFVGRVVDETGISARDVRLSLVGLDQVVDSILTSKDPLVQDWTIWSSAEARQDAADLRAEARLDIGQRPK